METAREMIAAAEEEGEGAEQLLASAIAIMSGVTQDTTRSLLNSKKGSQTWQMDINFEIRSSGFIYNMLEKAVNAEARAAAKGMRLLANNMGGVFDLPIEMTSVVESHFNDSDNVKLYKAESLPELAPLKARFFLFLWKFSDSLKFLPEICCSGFRRYPIFQNEF